MTTPMWKEIARFPDIGSITTITTKVPKMVFKNRQGKMLVLREPDIELFRDSKQFFHSHLKWFGVSMLKLMMIALVSAQSAILLIVKLLLDWFFPPLKMTCKSKF